MATNTTPFINGTDMTLERTIVSVTCFVILIIAHGVFLFFVGVILRAFFTNPHIKESPRYVFFVHMTLTDTLHLLVAFFLYIVTMFSFNLPAPFCYLILTLSTSSFRISPYSLAAMSLERYIAVCYPLQHPQLCTMKMTYSTIGGLWGWALIYNLADVIILSSVDKIFLSVNKKCNSQSFTVTREQGLITFIEIIVTFASVGLFIICTYIKVAWVAYKISSNKSSALKAGKTIMLHMFQLILYMMSFTSGLTNGDMRDFKTFIHVLNYLFFMCLPRFLSPLIYGIRDEVFRKYLSKLCSANQTIKNISM